jgi:hypothetical protein
MKSVCTDNWESFYNAKNVSQSSQSLRKARKELKQDSKLIFACFAVLSALCDPKKIDLFLSAYIKASG